jgi:hypothetical protein
MKQHHFIKYLLVGVSGLWLFGSIINCLFLAYFLLTGNDGYFAKSKHSTWGSKNIYTNGFPITVNATVQVPPDTIVKWKNNNGNSGEMYLNQNDYFRHEKVDSILADSSINKDFYFFNWVAENMSNNELLKQDLKVSVEKSFSFDTTANLKSKSLFKNIAFSLSSILNAIAMLLISFNIYKLISFLQKNTNFLSPLYKRTKYIGIILITNELIKFTLGVIYSKWFGIIRVADTFPLANMNTNGFRMQFNPTTGASFGTFLFGLTLIILSSLFKYGNKIENENALTV